MSGEKAEGKTVGEIVVYNSADLKAFSEKSYKSVCGNSKVRTMW